MEERRTQLLLLFLSIYRTSSAYPVRQTGPPLPGGGWTVFYPTTVADPTGTLRTVLYPLSVYNHNPPTQPAIGRNPLLHSVSEPVIGQNSLSVPVIGQELFQTPAPPQVKDTDMPVDPVVNDPQSQLQPYYPQLQPYYPQPYPYYPLTPQLLPNLETLTPEEQAQILSMFNIIPSVSQDGQTVFPTRQLTGVVGGAAQSQSASLSSEEEALLPVTYTRVMLPPAFQSQGLSVDPNPDPSPVTPDALPLTSDPGHAHLGNPPTLAPMGTPKPEVGGAVGVQMKRGVERGTEGGIVVREGGGVQIQIEGAGNPCPLEKSPPVRETQASTPAAPRPTPHVTHRLTHRRPPRHLSSRARGDGGRA